MKNLQKKILVIGRAGLDLYADPVNTPIEHATKFISQLGGSAANIAAGLAKQGNDVDIFSTQPSISLTAITLLLSKSKDVHLSIKFTLESAETIPGTMPPL